MFYQYYFCCKKVQVFGLSEELRKYFLVLSIDLKDC